MTGAQTCTCICLYQATFKYQSFAKVKITYTHTPLYRAKSLIPDNPPDPSPVNVTFTTDIFTKFISFTSVNVLTVCHTFDGVI